MATGLERDDQAKQTRLGQSYDYNPLAGPVEGTGDRLQEYWTGGLNRSLQDRSVYNQLMGAAQRGTPGYTADAANQAGARQYQTQTIQDLLKAARGDPNSYAQQQLRAGMGQARGNVSTLGAAVRGQGAGAAMRGIGATQAGLDMQQQQQSRILQVQEQQAATQALLQALQQQRQQDVGLAGMQAQERLGNTAESDRVFNEYMAAALRDSIGGANNRIGMAGAAAGTALQQQGINSDIANSLLGGLTAGAGTLGTMGGQRGYTPPPMVQANVTNSPSEWASYPGGR